MASHSSTLFASPSSFNLLSSHRLNPSPKYFNLRFPRPVKRLHFDLRCSVSIEKEVPETERPFTFLRDSDGGGTQSSSSSSSSSVRARFETMIRTAQDKVCEAIEVVEGGPKFKEDVWSRPGGGGGISRVLQDGNVWEKAGVNVSVVYGVMPPEAYRAAKAPPRLSKNQVQFRSLPLESARFCILKTLLLLLCISITAISRLMLQRMFLELQGNGGSVVGLISHLLTSSTRTSSTFIRFKSKPATNLIRPSTLGSRNGVMTTFTLSTGMRGEC